MRTVVIVILVCLLLGCGEAPPAVMVQGKTEAQWKLQAEDLSPSTKAEALEALGKFETPDVALIAKHMTESQGSVRLAAIRGLGHAGPAALPHAEALVAIVEAEVKDGPRAKTAKATRNAAMETLGAIGPEAFKSFSHMLVSESPRLRASAVFAMRPFVKELKDGINTVLPLVEDEHAVVRREAVKTLGAAAEGSRDPRACEALGKGINDPDAGVADAAALALGSVGGSADREGKALAELLYNHRTSTRASAAFALGLMGAEASPYTEQLVECLQSDARRVVRIQAARAHYRITGDASLALEQLEKDLQCSDTGLCRDAIRAIAEMGADGAPAVQSVIGCLDKPALRVEAAKALGAMGPGASAALPHLERAAAAAGAQGPARDEIDRAREAIRGE